MKQILIITLGIFFLWNSEHYKSSFNVSDNITKQKETLYFSNPKFFSLVSFGYNKVIAHYFWFRTLNYFGKHYKDDKQYEDLENLCNISTTLNKQNIDGFEFCSLMFAWELKEPEKAISILDSAIQADSTYWRYYYLRGIINAFFNNNLIDAKSDFLNGADCKDAPSFLGELAEKIDNKFTPNTLKILEYGVQEAKTKEGKEILSERLNEIQNNKGNIAKEDKK